MKRSLAIFLGWVLASSLAFAEVEVRSSGEGRLFESLRAAARAYEALNDYKAIFVKHETSADGSWNEEELIYLKFEKPFKIYMEWLAKKKGLQVVYERGRNRGKLAIHLPGFLFGLKPVIFLDQNSPYVREGSESSYDIEDAGIGTFLMDFTEAVVEGSNERKLEVEWTSGGEEARVKFPDTQKSDVYFAYRVNVRFDASSGLPTWMELFDWQDRPIGVYEYRDLKINVGADDEEFKKRINRHLSRVYHHA